MKAISASIVTLAGGIVFSVGAMINHNDTQLFVCLVGGVVGIAGLWVWITSVRSMDS